MNYILRAVHRQSVSLLTQVSAPGQRRWWCTAAKAAAIGPHSLEGKDLVVNAPAETVVAPAQEEQLDRLYSQLSIELRGVDPAVLKSYSWFATTAAGHLGIEVGNCWAERKALKDRMTLLKSVHIFKKHRVQYEVRTYIRHLNFHRLTGSTLDTFLEYIERNLPEGVALLATKTEIQSLPEHLRHPPAEEEEQEKKVT